MSSTEMQEARHRTVSQRGSTRLIGNRYGVRLARTRDDVEAALRLRFEIFNLELHEGLTESFFTGLDEDEFDQFCDHLIVVDEIAGNVVGTYRMQTGDIAAKSNLGFYSAREFDFTPYEGIRDSLIELGRACVHKDHRSFSVISLLWKGIISYAVERHAHYLIGCSSLTSQDPALGSAMFQQLSKAHLVIPPLRTQPLPALAIPIDSAPCYCGPPPKLLRAYLSVGARICGPPAIDREFGTIDFLTLLDIKNSPLNAQAHFLPRR